MVSKPIDSNINNCDYNDEQMNACYDEMTFHNTSQLEALWTFQKKT